MAAVTRDLEASSLAQSYEFTFIETWRESSGRTRQIVDFASALSRLVLWSLRPGPAIVHVHTAVRGSWYRKAVVLVVAKALRRPAVLQVHSGAGDIEAFWSLLGPVRRALIAWAFRRADRVLSVSQSGAGALRRSVGLDTVGIVRNAAPATRAGAPAEGNGGAVNVLYLGGFANPAKGGHVLADALTALVGNGSGIDLTLAGPGQPPPAAAALLARAERARWLGWLDEEAKEAAFGKADIVVFPSISEGLPIALLEAMAAGCSIVAARTGGMPEVLTDDVDAVLVQPADPAGLADAVTALAADHERRARLGRAAVARAARLNSDEVHRPLRELYDALGRRTGIEAVLGGNGTRDDGLAEVDARRNGDHRPVGRAGPGAVNGSGPADGHPRRLRALLVCSPGGHLQQMLALRPAWQGFEVSWATLRGFDVDHVLAGEDVAIAHGPTNRSVRKLLRNLVFAHRLLRQRRPDVILSTGAGIAVPIFLVGRLYGVRLVYVESLTRTTELSLSGLLAAPLAHEMFVQWPGAAHGRARYVGSIMTTGTPSEPTGTAGSAGDDGRTSGVAGRAAGASPLSGSPAA